MQSEKIFHKFNEKNSIQWFHYEFISGLMAFIWWSLNHFASNMKTPQPKGPMELVKGGVAVQDKVTD